MRKYTKVVIFILAAADLILVTATGIRAYSVTDVQTYSNAIAVVVRPDMAVMAAGAAFAVGLALFVKRNSSRSRKQAEG